MHAQHLTLDEQPIIALCSPRGSGAIALLRLSGIGVFELADRFSKLISLKKIIACTSHTIHYGTVNDPISGDAIDTVLFFVMHGPKTFTGQDVLEISCHNNPLIIDKIIQIATYFGARLARPGEFTKRAVLMEKIDLIQAEAINELIGAQTELALKKSLEQLSGSLSSYVVELESKLVEIIGLAEASFEFLDEEQRDFSFDILVQEKITALQAQLLKLKNDFNRQGQIKEGVKIALIGSVNVGKSTLFNALLGKDRALVSDIAGTTRDSIDAQMVVDGNFWSITDTAGLRQTGDVLEQQGIDRSWRQAALCDVIILVFDSSVSLMPEQEALYEQILEAYPYKIICVGNKIDKECKNTFLKSQSVSLVWLCAQTGYGIDALKIEIQNKVQTLFSGQQSSFLLNERHFNIISQLELALQPYIVGPGANIQYELMICALYQLLEQLSELTGKNMNDQVMDKIFGDFCVGK